MKIVTHPSFTVWSFDYDAAPHHHNELQQDTFACFDAAVAVARTRVKETNHNTGWSKIIDNTQAGLHGDRGVVAIFKKTRSGRVRMTYRRDGFSIQVQSKHGLQTAAAH